MKFTATESGFPLAAGSYPAKYLGIFEHDNAEATQLYGPGVKLKFDPTGEHAGKDIYVVCSKIFSTKSKLFGFAKQMNGGQLHAGDEFDFGTFVGKTFLLTVGAKPEGEGNTILAITPMPTE